MNLIIISILLVTNFVTAVKQHDKEFREDEGLMNSKSEKLSTFNSDNLAVSINSVPNPYNNYCGQTYTASTDCHQACPTGQNSECPGGEFCYTGLTFCAANAPSNTPATNVPLSTSAPQTSSKPMIAPTRKPTRYPTLKPTKTPTLVPFTKAPSSVPVSQAPVNPGTTLTPIISTSAIPTAAPTAVPTAAPVSKTPVTRSPTLTPAATRNNNYCGTSFNTALACAVACPSGTNAECPSGQFCYASVGCIGTLSPVSSPSLLPPTPPATDVGYYLWTWTGGHTPPAGTTLSIAFSGWMNIANALRERVT